MPVGLIFKLEQKLWDNLKSEMFTRMHSLHLTMILSTLSKYEWQMCLGDQPVIINTVMGVLKFIPKIYKNS